MLFVVYIADNHSENTNYEWNYCENNFHIVNINKKADVRLQILVRL
jgi:hypothetical protein